MRSREDSSLCSLGSLSVFGSFTVRSFTSVPSSFRRDIIIIILVVGYGLPHHPHGSNPAALLLVIEIILYSSSFQHRTITMDREAKRQREMEPQPKDFIMLGLELQNKSNQRGTLASTVYGKELLGVFWCKFGGGGCSLEDAV
jgi:hypothetical protein